MRLSLRIKALGRQSLQILNWALNIKERSMEPQPKKVGKFQALQGQIDPQLRQLWTKEQERVRKRILQKDDFAWKIDTLDLVAGVDISAAKHDTDIACASLIVYSIKNKQTIHEETEMFNISTQPYVPGFLAFREVPVLSQLFKRLRDKNPKAWPELLFVDGNGILHSNYCGLACHLGVITNIPTVGVGKTLFYIDGLGKQKVKEQCANDIKKAGDRSLLVGDSGTIWGAAIRNTENATNPIFVSIGHRISLPTAVECVLRLSFYRVVEPVRLADKHSRQLVEKWKGDKQVLPSFPMVYLPEE